MICQSGAIRSTAEGRTGCLVNGSSKKTSCSSSPLKNKGLCASPPQMRSPLSKRALFPLTALFVVLLRVREEELLGFAISRPELKS